MQNTLGELNLAHCIIYLDDVNVFGCTEEEHLKHLQVIGTVYRNYHCPALIITFIFPDLLPKILQTSSQECACPTRTYACLIKHYNNSQ